MNVLNWHDAVITVHEFTHDSADRHAIMQRSAIRLNVILVNKSHDKSTDCDALLAYA